MAHRGAAARRATAGTELPPRYVGAGCGCKCCRARTPGASLGSGSGRRLNDWRTSPKSSRAPRRRPAKSAGIRPVKCMYRERRQRRPAQRRRKSEAPGQGRGRPEGAVELRAYAPPVVSTLGTCSVIRSKGQVSVDGAETNVEIFAAATQDASAVRIAQLEIEGVATTLDYEPAESTNALFGGNSNWRGPVWFPINFLLIDALRRVRPVPRRLVHGRVSDRAPARSSTSARSPTRSPSG